MKDRTLIIILAAVLISMMGASVTATAMHGLDPVGGELCADVQCGESFSIELPSVLGDYDGIKGAPEWVQIDGGRIVGVAPDTATTVEFTVTAGYLVPGECIPCISEVTVTLNVLDGL